MGGVHAVVADVLTTQYEISRAASGEPTCGVTWLAVVTFSLALAKPAIGSVAVPWYASRVKSLRADTDTDTGTARPAVGEAEVDVEWQFPDTGLRGRALLSSCGLTRVSLWS